MANYDGGPVLNVLELTDGYTAAQLIEGYGEVRVVRPLRFAFGPGWWTKEVDGDQKTGKAVRRG